MAETGLKIPDCNCGAPAALVMHGYAWDSGNNSLCTDCGLQLVRKVMEDICELISKGGRHG
jgi:hypothetical protein